MTNKPFFDNPPDTDIRIGRYDKWQTPPGTFRNGRFQHIIWLGVNGYVIINHFAPREILLVDPWPSYRRFDLFRGTPSPRGRLLYLANWLRARVAEGYHLSGILVSHQHFDHLDDIPAVLEMLAAPGNERIRLKNIDHRVAFTTPAVPNDQLPTVFADRLSMAELPPKNRASAALLRFSEIEQTDGSSVTYNSKAPPLPPCGAALKVFMAGNFEVTPYMWDHQNLTKENWDRLGIPGSHQRMTAMNIRWKPVSDAKRTFILGSAGEMDNAFTDGDILPSPPRIETDTLIQSITYPGAPKYEKQLEACIAYQVDHITANDYVVPTHWEDYFFGPPKPAYKSKGFYRNHSRVDTYQNKWKAYLEKIGYSPADAESEVGKLVSLKRLRFEYQGIPGPDAMQWP